MESELERRVRERTRELQEVNEALRQSQQMLASELDAAQRLQHVATQLVNVRGTGAVYDQILDTAIAILHADFASIQEFYPERGKNGELRLLGHRGFSQDAVKLWEWVDPGTGTTCGEALRTGQRVVVQDVRTCDFLAGTPHVDAYASAGIRAVQSTPLASRSGASLGMVSTHWREPHPLTASELRSLDVLARLAADLIERSRGEEKLRESEQRLKNAERLAHIGHWQWDLRTGRLSGSEEAFRIFGKPQDYIPTHEGLIETLIPQDRERVDRAVKDSLARKTGDSIEYQIEHPDTGLRTVSCVWQVLVDEEGLPLRTFGTCQDITESRRAQEESLARQKLESVGALANGIAHDFNNILGGVLAQAQLALAECAAGSYPEDELKTIRDVSIRGSEIVRQLMIYAGRESADVGPVEVSRIVEEMLELLKVSVSKRAVLDTDLGENLPVVRANAAQLRQIVMNLVTNASDAIGVQDGVIRVTTEFVKAEKNSLGLGLTDGNYLKLEVSDTGCGMRPETKAKAFDPFFTTKSAGHGLGLAVVAGIVRGLGGSILLASELGKGTTFQILLPCAETGAGVLSDVRSNDVQASRGPYRDVAVLVVDDEKPLREGIARMLRQTGFDVYEAADGPSAIDLLRTKTNKIDMMLLDMTMPGASSHEIIAEAVENRPNIRVVLTSAYSQEMIAGGIVTPQIHSFIRKPFQFEDLVKTLCHTFPE